MDRPWTPKLQVFRHGAEQQPVIVIDDFARDPEQIIAEAAAQTFRPIGDYFPGVRAPTAPGLVAAIRQSLAKLIRETFDLGDELDRVESYYSLITVPPEALNPLQRMPHFDGLGEKRIALVHHLGRSGRGATGFYRHRSTGFETMTAERLPAYNAAVNAELRRYGLPGPGLIGADTPLFERIAAYEARFNRLLIYRGNTLHSAEAPPDLPLTTDPRTGRFSINSFIWLGEGG